MMELLTTDVINNFQWNRGHECYQKELRSYKGLFFGTMHRDFQRLIYFPERGRSARIRPIIK